jgi:hypothetical protein
MTPPDPVRLYLRQSRSAALIVSDLLKELSTLHAATPPDVRLGLVPPAELLRRAVDAAVRGDGT